MRKYLLTAAALLATSLTVSTATAQTYPETENTKYLDKVLSSETIQDLKDAGIDPKLMIVYNKDSLVPVHYIDTETSVKAFPDDASSLVDIYSWVEKTRACRMCADRNVWCRP